MQPTQPNRVVPPFQVALPSAPGFGVDALYNAFGQQFQGNSQQPPTIPDGSPMIDAGVLPLADGVTEIPVDVYSFNDYTNVLDTQIGTADDPTYAACGRIKTTVDGLGSMLASYSEAKIAIAADAAGVPSGTEATNLANFLGGGDAAFNIQTPGPETAVELAGAFVAGNPAQQQS